jgi:hypothetical protein
LSSATEYSSQEIVIVFNKFLIFTLAGAAVAVTVIGNTAPSNAQAIGSISVLSGVGLSGNAPQIGGFTNGNSFGSGPSSSSSTGGINGLNGNAANMLSNGALSGQTKVFGGLVPAPNAGANIQAGASANGGSSIVGVGTLGSGGLIQGSQSIGSTTISGGTSVSGFVGISGLTGIK